MPLPRFQFAVLRAQDTGRAAGAREVESHLKQVRRVDPGGRLANPDLADAN